LQVLRPKYKWKKFYFLETNDRWSKYGAGGIEYQSLHKAYHNPVKRTPSSFCRRAKVKGDKMFRSNWENGERGTPEQWKIKTKTIYPSYSFIPNYNSKLIKNVFNFCPVSTSPVKII